MPIQPGSEHPTIMVGGRAVPPSQVQNALMSRERAPPPIGSGADLAPAPSGNLLASPQNALAPAPAPQQVPMAAMPPATAPAPATAAMPADPDQQLASLGQQLGAANLTPAQVDQHAATYGAAVHHLGALVQKGAAVTHDDVVRQALYAVQDGSIAPDVAARFVENVKGPPQQLQAKLKQAVANTMLTNVALAVLKQRAAGAAPSSGQPPMNQRADSQS